MIFIVITALTLYFLIRNERVYKERMLMNSLVFSQENWETFLSFEKSISYQSMMYRFWVWPIHKMWPEELQELRNLK